MNRSKCVLCAAIACLLTCSFAAAENNVDPTPAPASTVAAAPTEQTSPSPESTPAASPEETSTAAPEQTPAGSPSAAPTESSAPAVDPTVTPPAETAPAPGSSPEATPAPGIEITVPGSMQLPETEIWQVYYQTPEDGITFTWLPVEGAAVYDVQLADSQENVLYEAQQSETELILPVALFAGDPYTLRVRALTAPADESAEPEILLEGEFIFALVQGQGEFPGGFPGGGFQGGGMGGIASGGSVPDDMLPGEDMGLRITPGEALTDSHSSGTKDIRLYGTVDLSLPAGAVTVLALGGDELPVTLDGGAQPFTVSQEGTTLILAPEAAGESWSVNAFALKTLARSGIETLRLELGETAVDISASWTPQGETYARLCAEGWVSKDYQLTVTPDKMLVSVAGATYELNENNELVGG